MHIDTHDGCQHTGMAYLEWLAEARKALVLGTDNFIARDFGSVAEFLDPSRLLPLLGQLDMVELLAPHHSRYRSHNTGFLHLLRD